MTFGFWYVYFQVSRRYDVEKLGGSKNCYRSKNWPRYIIASCVHFQVKFNGVIPLSISLQELRYEAHSYVFFHGFDY